MPSDPMDSFSLPHIPELPTDGIVGGALDRAAKERKGVVVLGEKGTGKNIAYDLMSDSFTRSEAASETEDPKYQPRRLLFVPKLRDRTYEGAVTYLLKKVLGTDPELRVRGRAKTIDVLRDEFVAFATLQNVAVLVMNEAEYFAPPVFELLRDLMASDDNSPERIITTADGRNIKAVGIGVLLLGTPRVERTVKASDEAGTRWVSIEHVPPVAPMAAGKIYARWFPGFAPYIARVGEAAWLTYISTRLCKSNPVPVARLRNHAYAYARLVFRNRADVTSRETIPFVKKGFEETWDGLLR